LFGRDFDPQVLAGFVDVDEFGFHLGSRDPSTRFARSGHST
jgi:hypothetical protein